MPDMVYIDGSRGEGGGQIVRSSLALSLVTGKPVSIHGIRAGRDKPGLMRQHLTAVHAAAEIGGAKLTGAAIGSSALTFEPGEVRAGDYQFSVGTAGSATLVLQTVLPALLIAGGSSRLTLEGGTHNPWAPPFDFLQRAFLPLVNRMGANVAATLSQHGFYPAGGGRFSVSIEPVKALRGFDLLERGEVRGKSVCALVSNLARHIAEREVDQILRKMNWQPSQGRIEVLPGPGPGNSVFAEIECDHVTEVFTGFGRVGTRAEQVAMDVVRAVRDYLSTDVPVGHHLADQLMLPLSISAWQPASGKERRGGTFRTMPLTRHSLTQIDILREFLPISIEVTAANERPGVNVRIAK